MMRFESPFVTSWLTRLMLYNAQTPFFKGKRLLVSSVPMNEQRRKNKHDEKGYDFQAGQYAVSFRAGQCYFCQKRDKYDFHKFAKSLNIVTELKSNNNTGVSISKCSPFC